VKLIHRLENSDADVVLGLFPTDNPSKMDMVDTDDVGRVTDIQIKPGSTTLDLTWIIAAWRPSFSAYVAEHHNGAHLGHVLQRAMADGLRVESQSFPAGRSLDIGTPDDLGRARTWSDQDDPDA
jgi:glucose-1-phosphate thymidylyltransferase